jgi:hypothetical protein
MRDGQACSRDGCFGHCNSISLQWPVAELSNESQRPRVHHRKIRRNEIAGWVYRDRGAPSLGLPFTPLQGRRNLKFPQRQPLQGSLSPSLAVRRMVSAMRPKKKLWTSEESERLKVMVAKGASPARAAAALRRNLASVRNQARKIGTPFPTLHQARRKLA